ncbi:MAG TPA: T9SS type A sorting domain-containing protein [Flavobacteriales bacterium]|nr:T9SS type A sorting domain-containing protein [Flavobacteriales bacterium]
MKKFLFPLLTVTVCLLTFVDASAKAPVPPPATNYYTVANGAFITNIWSTVSHVGGSCGCSPDGSCDIDIPSNTVIYIKHDVTTSCNVNIGNNATIIIESGGTFTVTGNANISGTGFFQVDAGGSATVTGNFSVSGTGDATINGTLNVNGNVTLTSGAGSNICGSGAILVGGTISGSADPCFTGALPIELTAFNAILNTNRVDVTWTTASEINNDYFTIERSQEGLSWDNIAVVAGAGTSNQELSYQKSDYSPLQGISYYRLKQTDYDGNSSYSEIAVVNNNLATDVAVTPFPNPADGNSIGLEFTGFDNEDVVIVIRDIQGREFCAYRYAVKGNATQLTIPFQNKLAAGMYVVVVSSNDTFATSKITVK